MIARALITVIIYLNSELGTIAKKSTDVHFYLKEGLNGQETIAAEIIKLKLSLRSILKANNWSVAQKAGLSAGTGKLCIFGHLGLVFIWSCFVSCLLLLLYYVICAPVLTEGTQKALKTSGPQ